MDGPGHPGRDVAQGSASRLSRPPGTANARARPRVAIVSNGNYFAGLGLAVLLASGQDELEMAVFVTASRRRPAEGPWRQTWQLLRRWGLRYASYKAGMLLLPRFAQVVRRRPYTLAAIALRLGIDVHHCEDLNEEPTLVGFAPDLLVSFSCPYRLARHVLDLPTVGAINVHSSLLPAYAGVCTYVHALAQGERETGVTIHAMTERFDAGPILAQETIAIDPGCSVFELFARQCEAAGRLLPLVVRRALQIRRLDGEPQDLQRRSYWSEPTTQDIRRLKLRGHHLFRRRDLDRLWSATWPVTP